MIDIVCPKGNEGEFLEVAKNLGFNELIFYYGKIDKKTIETINKLKRKDIIIYLASPVKSKDNDLVIIEKATRKDIESKPDMIFNQEILHEKDYLTNPNSGLDQVLCKIAKDKKVIIGFAFSTFLNSDTSQRIKLLPRIRQNIKLVRQYKLKSAMFSFARSPYEMRNMNDLRSFYCTLGMNDSEAISSLKSLKERIEYNEKKKKGLIICEGVEKIN